eukprot:5607059-Amphidinium_carterae.1
MANERRCASHLNQRCKSLGKDGLPNLRPTVSKKQGRLMKRTLERGLSAREDARTEVDWTFTLQQDCRL